MKARLKSCFVITASICASVYLLYTGGIDIFNSIRMLSDGVRTEGVVKEVNKKRSGGDSARFYAVIEYKGQDGYTYQFKNRRPYGYFFSPKKGESVEVLYLNPDPKVSVIDSFWQKFIGPLLSFAVGLLFLWFAAVEFKGLSKQDA
jgi:hypothetical protein